MTKLPQLAALALVLCVSATGWAQESTSVHAPWAIDRLAAQVADEISAQHPEAPLGLFVRGESNELSRAFASVLAAELGRRQLPVVVIDAPNAQAAEAEARAAGSRSLARLTLVLDSGLLHARGDLLGTWVNFWSGATPTRAPSAAAGLEASAEADAHALALAAVSPSGDAATSVPQTGELRLVGGVFARLPKWTAAIASGDLDGDEKAEVVALTDDELVAFAPDGRLLARRELRLLPSSATPSREPVGAVTVLSNPARVAYVSAQRARGEVLAVDGTTGFRVVQMIDEPVLAQVGSTVIAGKLNAGMNTFQPAVTLSPSTQLSMARPFTTLSAFGGPNGAEWAVVFADGSGQWRKGFTPESPPMELQGLGAGTALADLDGDGTPELVTSEDSYAPAPEVLRVLPGPSLGPVSDESVRFKTELPRGKAMQLAGADLDGDHSQELVVAVWMPDGTTELQVFRRAR